MTRARAMLVLVLLMAGVPVGARPMDKANGIDLVTGDSILEHIKVLASDAFEGRAPGTAGEERAVAYLADTCRKLGLAPGNPNGSYVQNVPFVGYVAEPTAAFTVRGTTSEFRMPEEGLAISHRVAPSVTVDASELVFVGYGAVAPEYDWDDFKGVDVRGKTIVVLVGDPPVPDPKDPMKLDDATFKGRAMTYYGRWMYKYEIASERGAAGCIIVHETEPAGYGYAVLERGYGQEYFDIASADKNAGRVGVEAWMTVERARRLFTDCGADYDALKSAAARRDFRPVALGATAHFDVKLTTRDVASRNVVARVPGSDPVLGAETIVYSAHWDHFGKKPGASGGDEIFNGAIDDGSGCAEILEIARAFGSMAKRPKRSILFLFTTGEEQGLLGAKYYARHPLYPLETTLADINLDIMNMWGRTRSVVSISLGASTLDEVLADVAKGQGRRVVADPEPEKGYFYRSDHLELMRRGVPALTFLHPGADYVGQPADYGQRKRDAYVTNDYHKPTDEVRADWDMTGAVDDVRMLFEVGRRVADGPQAPTWKAGSEFKAIRERSLERAAADTWAPLATGLTAGLRGLAAVDARTAWASGTGGTWARTIDGGATWTAGVVPDAAALDFRAIHAFGPASAIVMSAGDDARIYRTDDAGRTWRLSWRRKGPTVFFDALAFWDDRHGIAIGDPVDGRFAALTTADGGATWTDAAGPAALPNEAAFAASNTSVALGADGRAWLGTGGGASARVLRSSDYGRTWTAADTPIRASASSAGVFSVAFVDATHGVAVGGDFSKPGDAAATAAVTDDGGATWRLAARPPSGYRSCVAQATVDGRPALVAVGPSGTDVSVDGGNTWTPAGASSLNVAAFYGAEGWAAGPDGRIARWRRARARTSAE